MTGLGKIGHKYDRAFVKRSPLKRPAYRQRGRSDRALMKLIATQERALTSIEHTRLSRGLSIERFAAAAGIGERSYRRALKGQSLLRVATLAKLKTAQRKAAAGYLS